MDLFHRLFMYTLKSEIRKRNVAEIRLIGGSRKGMYNPAFTVCDRGIVIDQCKVKAGIVSGDDRGVRVCWRIFVWRGYNTAKRLVFQLQTEIRVVNILLQIILG